MAINMSINAESVEVETSDAYEIRVHLKEVDEDDVLESIDIDAAVNFYGVGKLLDAIGRDEAIDHFGIEEAE